MKIINHLKSPKNFNIDELICFLVDELKIGSNVELILTYNDSLLDKLSSGQIDYSAMLYHPAPNKYALYVKSGVNLAKVLCHEFVHLEQHERGDLIISKDFSKITWKGTEYDNYYPYDQREWEIEAIVKQRSLLKKFKQLIKRKKKNETTSN